MDVQEIKKLDGYLKKLFGNQRLRVVPKKTDEADVFVGEERVGGLTVDDEDEERSYNLEIKITLGEAANIKNLKTLEAYLRRKFDTELIRVVARPRKTDSARSISARNISGSCSSTRKKPDPAISRWQFSPSIWKRRVSGVRARS